MNGQGNTSLEEVSFEIIFNYTEEIFLGEFVSE